MNKQERVDDRNFVINPFFTGPYELVCCGDKLISLCQTILVKYPAM